ncbi:MAG: quinohemoprotein amine dehydrogenase subunit alpha [Planctomycetota bacterium]
MPQPSRYLLTGLFCLAASIILGTPALAQDDGAPSSSRPSSQPAPTDAKKKKPSTPKKPKIKPGLPITNELLKEKCVLCHQLDDRGHMTRISYMRKSPEGWEITLKRMVRLQQVYLEGDDARLILRYLASEHGLTREEAARGMYENERRVHWTEEKEDEDFRKTCAACHALGRVLNEYRDADEWKLLKTTHLAMFPLADFQAFRGSRRRGGGSSDSSEPDWASMSESEIDDYRERQRAESKRKGDRADKVMKMLAKEQPLFTDSWKSWKKNRREIPIAGTWNVIGYEVGRGQLLGHCTIKKVDDRQFTTQWTLQYPNGDEFVRSGKGLLYGGFSWRGRNEIDGATGDAAEAMKEVMILDEAWNTFKGRLFRGEYNELGIEVELMRRGLGTALHGVIDEPLQIPATDAKVVVVGSGFPPVISASDFHLGQGVTIKGTRRLDNEHIELTVDVALGSEPGLRCVSFGAIKGKECLTLYDYIDYLKIEPLRGFSRIGGGRMPKQFERFEAIAMNRGPDDKIGTADDIRVKRVDATWKLEEFPVRDGDDDVLYVGVIDAQTGVFTPGIDGPNPKRKWQANNIGDVYVAASVELKVRKRFEKKKKKSGRRGGRKGRRGGRRGADAEAQENSAEAKPVEEEKPASKPVVAKKPEPEKVVFETRLFRSRGHLLVTVPIYTRYDRLNWESED